MTKIKHVYVNDKLVGIGNVKVEEIEKEPKYFVKITHDDCVNYPYENASFIKFYSNHRYYVWDTVKMNELLSKFDKVPKNVEELVDLLNKTGEYNYVAVYSYEHGDLSVSLSPFSCTWDSGLLGILQISKEYTDPQKVAEDWVKTVNMWLQGEVYCVRVVNELGEYVDNICGIYAKNAEELIKNASEHISADYRITDEDYKKAFENKTYM